MMNVTKEFPRIVLVIWASSVLLIAISIYCFIGKPADMFQAVGLLVFSSILTDSPDLAHSYRTDKTNG